MRVFAIGATGFIGSHVISRLLTQGHEIGVLHRGETGASFHGSIQFVRGNRDRLDDFRIQVDRFAPDVIVDMIPYTERQAQDLATIARRVGARVVAISSGDVYRNYDGFRGKATAPPDPVPLAENGPLRESRYPYRGQGLPFEYADDYDKILVERALFDDPDVRATIVRLPAVYGPGDRQHRLRPWLDLMRTGGDSIVLGGRQAGWRWTRGFVENAAAAVALIVTADRCSEQVYNAGDDATFTEYDWVKRIAAVTGWHGEVSVVPDTELPVQGRQPGDWRYHLWMDTTALGTEFGFVPPVAVDDALRRTAAWELAQIST
jgi:nucleoside-diphosphate-sugar epimerase